MADVVAIEELRMQAKLVKGRFQMVGNGRLSSARQAGEPENARFLILKGGPRGLIDVERLACDVLRPIIHRTARLVYVRPAK